MRVNDFFLLAAKFSIIPGQVVISGSGDGKF